MTSIIQPMMTKSNSAQNWLVQLFNKSVLKQRKYKELTHFIDPRDGLDYLDIGSDNGVISYLLRQEGGAWKSADLDEQSVSAIKMLAGADVYQISGERTPFMDNEFDCVVIVDFLEHIPNDYIFIEELFRIIKPNGTLIINVPHIKNSLLRKFRLAIGQTDEKHGHLRPGYTIDSLRALLGDRFNIETHKTYSKFFSELIDTIIVQAVYFLQRNKRDHSKKGALVTNKDLNKNEKLFFIYTLIYPIVYLISKLDDLLIFNSGYMLIAKTQINKETQF